MFKNFFQLLFSLSLPNRSHLIALCSGGLGIFAFSPFDFFPLILVSLGGLFLLWLGVSSRFEGFKIGLWYGLGFFGLGVSWLYSSVYIYTGVFLPLAILMVFGFVLFLSLFIAAGGWLSHYFKSQYRTGLILVVIFPAIWVMIELTRSSVLGGYPFLLIGNTHIETWLAGYAPIFGVWGMSWAVAISASLLLWLYQECSWVWVSVIVCLLWSIGGLLQNIEWVKPLDEPIEVALVQGNVAQDKKWKRAAFIPTMEYYIKMTKANMDVDLVVWPETAIPSYYEAIEHGALYTFIQEAKMLNTDILVGTVAGNKKSGTYNALINLHHPQERYYKHHLVPFGEFFLFEDLFAFMDQFLNVPFSNFNAGETNQLPLKLGGYLVGLSICFETAFGNEMAQQLPEAKYLVTVSNDAWFAHTLEPAQQLQDVRMRALELGREIARSTNTGYTAIIDIQGNIKQQIPAYKEGVLRGKVQPYEGLTFYAEWGRKTVLFMLFSLFGFLFMRHHLLKGCV